MKFIESKSVSDYEVLTDTGFVDIKYLHKTIKYEEYEVVLDTNETLICADTHIVFNEDHQEVFVKDLQLGDGILTKDGKGKVIEIKDLQIEDNMYDLELSYGSKERYYTNGILSHNTSYLRYLTKFITKKEILFIPPSMAEMLAEPSIIPFLIENKNCVLIIEDAEKVISDRETNVSAGGVSNILNLTDGILGDCLNVQIIATFNIKRDKIDQALLRKGRLIAEHKFEELSIDETNKLLKYLNKNTASDKGLTLADIYNIDSDEIRVKSNKNKIGFKF